jgi:Protein of unknown function
MDPVLLLRYSIEKINVPSGEKMFRWLCKQSATQDYFVYLFWLVKVKFFEKDSHPENEIFLLRGLSVQYVKIMELLATHGHGAEYEKDFAYQYLPYILSNAVYFGFFYLCPGSRHIYTKGFKKSILLQVVKVMHGLQLCTASVKLLWLRLFPEDTHEVEDEGEDLGEIFPVQIAVGYDSKCSEVAGSGSGSGSFDAVRLPPCPGLLSDQDFLDLSHSCLSPTSRPSHSCPPSAGRVRISSPGDDARDESREGFADLLATAVLMSECGSPRTDTEIGTSCLPSPLKSYPNSRRSSSSSQSADMKRFLQHLVLPSDTQHQWGDRRNTFSQPSLVPLRCASLQSVMRRSSTNSHSNLNKQCRSNSEVALTAPAISKQFRGPLNGPNVQTILRISVDSALASENPSGCATPIESKTARATNAATTSHFSTGSRQSDGMYNLTGKHGSNEGASYISKSGNPSPLARTLLKGTSPKLGHSPGTLTRRQSSEALNMKSVSPLMQEYFASSVCAPVKIDIGAQMMRRTVPISWCATGGADTHRKRVIQTDLHQTSTDRRKEAAKEFLKASYLGKKNRLDGLRNINSKCIALLQSDAATIGRFSLDLVKRQQQRKAKGDFSHSSPLDDLTSDVPSVSDVVLAANFDPADLDAFLARI